MRLAWLFVLSSALAPAEARAQAAQLTVILRAEAAEVRAGDEIPLTFTITNKGTGPYEYTDRTYDRSGRMGEYALEVHDERGALVPDPRSLTRYGWIGGGISRRSVLEPGESFTRTIPLNLWAHITRPGLYRVRGHYRPDRSPAVVSPFVDVRVLARTDAEMARRIAELTSALGAADSSEARVSSIKALMYTGDRRAARGLLEVAADDNNTSFWIQHAFRYYLPRDTAMLREVQAAIRHRGMMPWQVEVLEQLGASRGTMKTFIARALTARSESSRSAGALAAQRFPDDRFTPGLAALATSGPELTRVQAIYALARNRTDASVETLRALLRDPSEKIRASTTNAIEDAYRAGATGGGRPLRPDDFSEIAKRVAGGGQPRTASSYTPRAGIVA